MRLPRQALEDADLQVERDDERWEAEGGCGEGTEIVIFGLCTVYSLFLFSQACSNLEPSHDVWNSSEMTAERFLYNQVEFEEFDSGSNEV